MAEVADFFSFGTNDLTQMSFGFSRDDIGGFLSTVSLIQGVDTPSTVPQALLSVSDSLGDSVGSMQALAIANPDLYIFLADMIQGTKSTTDVSEATQSQFAELAKAQGAAGF